MSGMSCGDELPARKYFGNSLCPWILVRVRERVHMRSVSRWEFSECKWRRVLQRLHQGPLLPAGLKHTTALRVGLLHGGNWQRV